MDLVNTYLPTEVDDVVDLFDQVQPIWVVNGYIWSELKKASPKLAAMWPNKVPLFPVNDSTSGITQWEGKPYFIYNEAFRVNHDFYEIKKSTFIYSMRATPAQTIPLSNALQKILDREDDAASDINDFNNSLPSNQQAQVHFHSLRIYQNEPAKPRDGAVEPYVVSTFMVVVKYNWLTTDLPQI